MKRIFFAHTAQASPEEVRYNCKRLKDLLGSMGGNEDETFKVVPGRADHQSHFRGNWDNWQKDVVNRTNATTGQPVYDMFIVLGKTCGRATSGIISQAIDLTRPCMRWDGKEVLDEVTEVRVVDPDDWQAGWKLHCPVEQLYLFDTPSDQFLADTEDLYDE